MTADLFETGQSVRPFGDALWETDYEAADMVGPPFYSLIEGETHMNPRPLAPPGTAGGKLIGSVTHEWGATYSFPLHGLITVNTWNPPPQSPPYTMP